MKTGLYLLVGTFVTLLGCQPEPNGAKLYDELAVATNYDNTADFGSYATFAIPSDTLGLISNTDPNDSLLTSKESTFPKPGVEKIIDELEARGYTRVTKNANPDLGVRVILIDDYNVFQEIVYPNSYYGPGGYYSGYYGYNSWYYYPYINTYTSKNAMIAIEILDLKNKTPDNKVKVIWAAYMGDLYGTLSLTEQTESGIAQAFTQSPFLSAGSL